MLKNLYEDRYLNFSTRLTLHTQWCDNGTIWLNVLPLKPYSQNLLSLAIFDRSVASAGPWIWSPCSKRCWQRKACFPWGRRKNTQENYWQGAQGKTRIYKKTQLIILFFARKHFICKNCCELPHNFFCIIIDNGVL